MDQQRFKRVIRLAALTAMVIALVWWGLRKLDPTWREPRLGVVQNVVPLAVFHQYQAI